MLVAQKLIVFVFEKKASSRETGIFCKDAQNALLTEV